MAHPFRGKGGRTTASERYASGGTPADPAEHQVYKWPRATDGAPSGKASRGEGTQGTQGPGRKIQPTDLYDADQLRQLERAGREMGRKQGGRANG